jgi:sugar phosphate isomerase/epimerase
MKEFGLQLYSIDNHFTCEEDTRESFRIMKECGYTHAQTAGTYDYISPEKFRALADEYGIKLMGTHYEWDLICNDVEGTAKYHKTIGAEYIGIGGTSFGTPPSKERLLNFIDKFNEMAKIYVEDYGFKALTYHNHVKEFRKIEGRTIMEWLIEGLDKRYTGFVLDSLWAHLGGENVCELIDAMGERVVCVHLKDLDPCHTYLLENGRKLTTMPKLIEVGEGNMKFKGIIKAAEKYGCKYFTVEDEYYTTGESYDSIRTSAKNIKEKFLDK